MPTVDTETRPRGTTRLARLADAQTALRTLRAQERGDAWLASALGVHPRTVASWRGGTRVPSPLALEALRTPRAPGTPA